MTMPNDVRRATDRQDVADWTGVKIAAIAAPVFFSFVYFGRPEIGFTVYLASAALLLAIKLRWQWSGHAWFWGTIALIVAIHIPLVLFVRWPHTNLPTIAFSMPLGMADFLLISGALSLAEKVFCTGGARD
jgi:hypothetical protein